MIDVHVNGSAMMLPEPTTVGALVALLTGRALDEHGAALDGEPLGIAVAVNEAVVPRGRWSARGLVVGDRVEVLTAAQGG
ncbi:sulfur carrier protein ThiS [Agromyces sp. ISL-38]|uniref:sulfur carrier protein ThiS n=1 Tax=Agromyces sp. ISL-38 TaxID=2819107 RepID=UPI001BEC6F3C|nr:sulfur carrier protein ThiS [Agromyces sp. ISL-38]MBT2500391.1 sulfur carrier protein ThiS [Agromyces sp. ISL-38]